MEMSAAPTIAISGMGVVSAAGADLAATLKSFAAARRPSGPLTLFRSAIEAPVFEAHGFPGDTDTEGQRTHRLALAAVREALAEAGLPSDLSGLRAGVCLGTTVACQLNDLDFYDSLRRTGAASMAPVERFLKGNLAAWIARQLRSPGPCATVTNACASGTDAIGVALAWLRNGACDLAIAGGSDELNRIPYCGFHALGVMSSTPCAPFDRNRQGLNLGEGAGVVVLETAVSAQRRGLTPRLAMAGYGSASDAYHMTAPRPDGSGLEAAIRRALREAGCGPDDIAFVNAHGTGTRDNDKVESLVFERLFGNRIAFLSTKGFTGHTLGAAGGMEAVFAAAGLREGWIPASAGYAERDDELPLAPVKERTLLVGDFALSTSLAFGGTNSALVIRRVA
jgi:3-oxoacyl-(acyl-carrier-protein) synthase